MITDLDYRKQLARELLSSGMEPADFEAKPDSRMLSAAPGFAAPLGIPFPARLKPIPQPLDPNPAGSAALPKADVVVVTWTVDEARALSDVLTPGYTRDHWYRYDKSFTDYLPQIRSGAYSILKSSTDMLVRIGPK